MNYTQAFLDLKQTNMFIQKCKILAIRESLWVCRVKNGIVFSIHCNTLYFICLSLKSLKRMTLNLAARESDQYLKKILFSEGKRLTNMQQSTYQQIFMKAVSSTWTKWFYYNIKLIICFPFFKENNFHTNFSSLFLVQMLRLSFFLPLMMLQICALLGIWFILRFRWSHN